MKKFLPILGLLLFSVVTLLAQERVVSGTVTDQTDGSTLPGVNVLLKGTSTGAVTDVNGEYKISVPEAGGVLVFSSIGFKTQEVEVGSQSTIDVGMSLDVTELSEIVITALGESRETKTLPYAAQQITAENLNITQNVDVKSALAGKVAGVQINSQAGSKLGEFGKIRIRGGISLSSDSEPLYVLDGVPVSNPNDIDMNNIESVNILKGPNATALYGQRADAGVVVLTSKKGKRGEGVRVEVMNSTTFDKVGYLPNMQNEYGGGYEGDGSWGTFAFDPTAHPAEWAALNGKRYITWDNNYADESWGPKFDDQEYVPWYAWWEDGGKNPYFGKTQKYSAQPNNIKDFYETGVTSKNTIAVTGGQENFNVRLSYSNLYQNGITPYTDYKKDYLMANFDFDASDKLTISTNVRYASDEVNGDFTDGYGNQTSGSFNSWFSRGLEMDKMRELKDIKTPAGYTASWNWWGPDYYTYGGGFEKPAFWYNPYTFLENYNPTNNNDNLTGLMRASYKLSDNLVAEVAATMNSNESKSEFMFPFSLSNSAAPELYNAWSHSLGKSRSTKVEKNYYANLKYSKKFDNFDLSAIVGGNIRKDEYSLLSTWMNSGAKSGGLIMPDIFIFQNAGITPVTNTLEYRKQVNSMYGNASFGYMGMLYLDGSVRRDYSSALPVDKNGYTYGSLGGSFIFSEVIDGLDFLSFGKVRGSYAKVGTDVGALATKPTYPLANQPYGENNDNIVMYVNPGVVNPSLRTPQNTSIEGGLDLKFLENKLGLQLTIYSENRKDNIIPLSVSRASGYNDYLTNAGETQRKGIEISLIGDILDNEEGLSWNTMFNFAVNKSQVISVAEGIESIQLGSGNAFGFISVIHQEGEEYGQLRGTGIAKDSKGNPILQSNGLYKTVDNQYFGSILPAFTGGWINRLSYKDITATASIDFQKGGKFFSLTEQWGQYSGLLQETAELNDKGNNVRDDATADGGGVHVTGVDESGSPVDMYVDGLDYFTQFYGNRLAEPFIHDASFIKLREVALNYNFTSLLSNTFIKSATIGVVGRNLALLAVSKDNVHRWDPSELSRTFGEDGQLPGTRSYGFNLNITF